MKKTIAVGIICLTMLGVAQAQIFTFGIKGGSSINKISGASFEKKFDYGYHLGGFAQVKLTKKITLQPEVLFNQNNTTVDSNFAALYNSIYNPNYRKNITLKYLSIPLVVNYNLNKLLSLQAGAQYGILMNGNQDLFQNGQQAFTNGDFAVLTGVQLKVWRILLTGRYIIGMQSINDVDNTDKWKSQTAQLSVGIRL